MHCATRSPERMCGERALIHALLTYMWGRRLNEMFTLWGLLWGAYYGTSVPKPQSVT